MMEMTATEAFILAIGALGLGMIMLIRGGNWTIDAAVYIARKMGISPLVVGFTVVAFGTSLPELIVSVNASLHGSPGIAVGNVLGSNVANILLVIGITALFTTLVIIPRALIRDLAMMMAVTVGLLGLMLYGEIGHLTGCLMILILLAYVFWQYIMAARGQAAIPEPEQHEFNNIRASVSFLVMGLILIALGAEFLVRGAKVGAAIIGVPEAVIGLSVIAVGTSLPELSTCIIAARKNHSDIIVGNIIGSNVFNIMMILGATAAIKPIIMGELAPQLINIDIWVTLAVSLLLTVLLLIYKKITKPIGILFIAAYMVYIVATYAFYMA
ncbi:MAG: calcium/sodium antiporter [Rhodospirillales bacterium]|nr:calcium/sodium antiporter [Rhodospirillales bacterium]